MFNLKDRVRVNSGVYSNEPWTKEELIVTSKSIDIKSDIMTYKVTTVSGCEVEHNLYENQLHIVIPIPPQIAERLKHSHKLIEYSVEGLVSKHKELNYLDKIFNDYYSGVHNLTSLVNSHMKTFLNVSLGEKLKSAEALEPYISHFLAETETRVDNLVSALDGGLKVYLCKQFYENNKTFCKNSIYIELNDLIEDISKEYNENTLEDSSNIFLKFDFLEIRNFVDEFVESKIDMDCIYKSDTDNLYSEFCNYLSHKIEH